ncbi:hypothetical protein HYR99_04770 [Candidatus Poribacteria bacterium]|nr:hypothetical protein [Candidatus Poribacteria bacterium]
MPVKPLTCLTCGHPLCGAEKTPQRHPVTAMPPMVGGTMESQLHTLQCPACGTHHRAQLPGGVSLGAFGPRIPAMGAALRGPSHLSKRQKKERLSDFFGISIGLGSVFTLEQATSEARQAPCRLSSRGSCEEAVPPNPSDVPFCVKRNRGSMCG